METFAFSKTMNKLIRSSLFVMSAFVAGGLALGAPRAGAQSASSPGADRITVKLDDPSRPALVKASLINGGITVKGYDGKEVIVEARTRNEESDRSSSNGLKRLNIARTGLTVEEENNQVHIGTDSHMRTIDLMISVPIHTSLVLRALNDGDVMVTDVDGEIDVDNTNGAVTLKNVSGSVVAHALNGHVRVTFVKVNPQKAMAFSSLNGDIDVTFPADLKANLRIRSDQGDVFSDFDVQLQTAAPQQTVEDGRGKGGKYRVRIDKSVLGTINGGGQEITFTNLQGGIYIRKAGSPR
jgi:DUF4097 and DUF4098 domain-containing protein YvlB